MIHYTVESTLDDAACDAITGGTDDSCTLEITEVECVTCVRVALSGAREFIAVCEGVLMDIDPEGDWQ